MYSSSEGMEERVTKIDISLFLCLFQK